MTKPVSFFKHWQKVQMVNTLQLPLRTRKLGGHRLKFGP